MVLRKDYPYILLSIVTSILAATAVSDLGNSVGTYALLGLFGIGVVMAIIITPSLGANILLIAVFSNLSVRLIENGLPGIIKPLVAVVFGAILIRNYYTGQIPFHRPKIKSSEFFLFLYFAAVSLSYLAASDKDVAMESIIDFAKDILMMYCILFCIRNFKEWKRAILIVIGIVFVLNLLSAYQVISGNLDESFLGFSIINKDDRVSGPINEPNMWGQVIVTVMPFIIFGFLRSNMAGKIVYASILLIFCVGLINTYSRGSYLAFFLIIILIFFFFKKTNIFFASIIFGAIILLLPFLPASYQERFNTLTLLSPDTQNGVYEEGSFRGRTSEMIAGWKMFTDHPIIGVGSANYPLNYQKYAQIIGIETRAELREAHSLYLETLAETGILGFLSFVGLIIFLFQGLANVKLTLNRYAYTSEEVDYFSAMQVSLVAYLFASSFLHGAFIRFFWMLVALAMALIQISYEMTIQNDRYEQKEI